MFEQLYQAFDEKIHGMEQRMGSRLERLVNGRCMRVEERVS